MSSFNLGMYVQAQMYSIHMYMTIHVHKSVYMYMYDMYNYSIYT